MNFKLGDRVTLNYPYPHRNNGAVGIVIATPKSKIFDMFNGIFPSYFSARVCVQWNDEKLMGTSMEKISNLKLVPKPELKLV